MAERTGGPPDSDGDDAEEWLQDDYVADVHAEEIPEWADDRLRRQERIVDWQIEALAAIEDMLGVDLEILANREVDPTSVA